MTEQNLQQIIENQKGIIALQAERIALLTVRLEEAATLIGMAEARYAKWIAATQ